MVPSFLQVLLASAMVVSVLCSPQPQYWQSWQMQDTTVTELQTVTSISISISMVTFCPKGSSHSKPSMRPLRPLPSPLRPQPPPQPASQSPDPPNDDVTYNGAEYVVAGVGSFKNKKEYSFNSTTLPDGLFASNYTVRDTENGCPYNHRYDPANVYCDGTYLNLKVPGGQKPSPGGTIDCAEVATNEKNIKYASVRMNVIFSDVPGTCHGLFFYLNDTQECDMEYLTDPASSSNAVDGQAPSNNTSIPLWLTNQAVKVGQKATQSTASAPRDITIVHEYRIDWVEDHTAFYVDGKMLQKYTTNVPTKAGAWIWNNWSNGDKGWSVGPPAKDNIMRIRDITMYYNTTSDAGMK